MDFKLIGIFPAALILSGCLAGGSGSDDPDGSGAGGNSDSGQQTLTVREKQIQQCGSHRALDEHWNICDDFFTAYPEHAPKGLWMPSGKRRPKQHFFIPGLIDSVTDLNLTGEGAKLIIDDGFFSSHELFDTSYLAADSMRVTDLTIYGTNADNITDWVTGWLNVFEDNPDSHGTAVYSMATGEIGIAPSATTTLLATNKDSGMSYKTDNYEHVSAGILNASHSATHFPVNRWSSSVAYGRQQLMSDDRDEIKAYADRGGVFVQAAGNDNGFELSQAGGNDQMGWDNGCKSSHTGNDDPLFHYKDGIADPVCVASALHELLPDAMIYVGSINMENNEISSFSNVPGSDPAIQKRFIVAPGEQVTLASTYRWISMSEYIFSDTGTTKRNGTSYSAPAVSGAIALVKQAKPEMSYKEAMQWILDNADKSFAGYDPAKHGVGRLDLTKLITKE